MFIEYVNFYQPVGKGVFCVISGRNVRRSVFICVTAKPCCSS